MDENRIQITRSHGIIPIWYILCEQMNEISFINVYLHDKKKKKIIRKIKILNIKKNPQI